MVPDEGFIRWQSKVHVGYLDQYSKVDESQRIFDYLRTAFQDLFEAEQKLKKVNEELLTNPDPILVRTAANLQDQLEQRNFYAIDSEVQKVAAGLGITPLGLDRPLGKLSGGQRAKVILAKLLLENPQVLLLDEPTNFLDTEHVDWLVKFLKGFKGAFIIISHDADFLDRTCTCICDLEFNTIKKYSGGYQSYLKQKEQQEIAYLRRYESQQREIERTEDYIAATRCGLPRQPWPKAARKSWIKWRRSPRRNLWSKPNFKFPYESISTQKALEVTDLEVGYYYSLLPKLSFTVATGKKMVFYRF